MNNKNLIPIIAGAGVLVLAVAGYAAWIVSHPSQVAYQNPTATSAPVNSNPGTSLQPGVPVVSTDASTVPYISTVVVKGTVNPNGAPTTYWYEYGETSSLGTQTPAYVLGSGYTTMYTPAYITGLRSNTNYYFRLSAKNYLGTVAGATYSFKTNNTPAPQGTAPTVSVISATDVTRTTANLHGRVNSNGSETTFWFEYGLTPELGAVTAFQSAGSGTSSLATSVSVSNLQASTKYYFRLNAQNQFGTTNSQILSFVTQGPAQPSAPTVNTTSAAAVTDSSAKLNASVNPNGVATTYWFEYSDNSLVSNISVSSTLVQSLSSGTLPVNVSANITNLNNNTKYSFRVVAQNQYGIVRGDIQTFTTKK